MRELTESEKQEMTRLKNYFPFRIVYGAISPSGEFQCGAVSSKRIPNDLAKKGHTVFILSK